MKIRELIKPHTLHPVVINGEFLTIIIRDVGDRGQAYVTFIKGHYEGEKSLKNPDGDEETKG